MNTTLQQFKKKKFKNSLVKESYKELAPEYAIVKYIIAKRIKKNLTQKELAEAIGTKQPVISRLENGTGNPTLKTLHQVAKALDMKLEVTLR